MVVGHHSHCAKLRNCHSGSWGVTAYHILALHHLCSCGQRLSLVFFACQRLPARLIRTITWKRHYMLHERLPRQLLGHTCKSVTATRCYTCALAIALQYPGSTSFSKLMVCSLCGRRGSSFGWRFVKKLNSGVLPQKNYSRSKMFSFHILMWKPRVSVNYFASFCLLWHTEKG